MYNKKAKCWVITDKLSNESCVACGIGQEQDGQKQDYDYAYPTLVPEWYTGKLEGASFEKEKKIQIIDLAEHEVSLCVFSVDGMLTVPRPKKKKTSTFFCGWEREGEERLYLNLAYPRYNVSCRSDLIFTFGVLLTAPLFPTREHIQHNLLCIPSCYPICLLFCPCQF